MINNTSRTNSAASVFIDGVGEAYASERDEKLTSETPTMGFGRTVALPDSYVATGTTAHDSHKSSTILHKRCSPENMTMTAKMLGW